MKDITGLITLFFIGALVVLIIMHAPGFATVANSSFSGVNSLGQTLTGTGVTNAVYSGAALSGPGLA